MRRPWTVLADPGGVRIGLLSKALARGGWPEPIVVDYGRAVRDGVGVIGCADVLRLDGPGRSPATWMALVAHGRRLAEAEGAPVVSPRRAPTRLDRATICGVRQWYLGLSRLLREVRRAQARVWLSDPDDVAVLFDKPATHARLDASGVAVPPALSGPSCFEELWAGMATAGFDRVFVKLSHGSAASGIVALSRSSRGVLGWTTVETVRDDRGVRRLVNSRRLRRLGDVDVVAEIVDGLAPEGLHVEAWVPKAGLDGKTFDLRVLVVAGEVAHVVARLARGPITNLHLLNERRAGEAVRERMDITAWEDLRATAARVASCFPANLQLALDVAVLPGFRRHRVLEVNAFGDLLKGAVHRGMDPYELQIRVFESWHAGRAVA